MGTRKIHKKYKQPKNQCCENSLYIAFSQNLHSFNLLLRLIVELWHIRFLIRRKHMDVLVAADIVPAGILIDRHLNLGDFSILFFLVIHHFYTIKKLLWLIHKESAEIRTPLFQKQSFPCFFLIKFFNFR